MRQQMGPERHVSAVGSTASEPAGSFRDGEALDDVIRAGERVMPGVQGQQQGIRILRSLRLAEALARLVRPLPRSGRTR